MKKVNIFLLTTLTLIVILFLIRLTSPTQIDDVHPEIPCPELETYNPDFLYIIPNFNNSSISQNQTFCKNLLSKNKTIAMHGINHQPYREFLNENISQEDLTFALEEFQECFNQIPEKFKPPQLRISQENKILIKENNLKLETWFNQLTHKVYHCNDEGIIGNKWIKLF